MKPIRENLLRKIANKSDHKIQSHSAIIIKGSRLVAQGYNHGTRHAEESAINQIKHKIDLSDCVLVSFRIGRKSGNIGNSRPCSSCRSRIMSSGISKVIFFDGKRWVEWEVYYPI